MIEPSRHGSGGGTLDLLALASLDKRSAPHCLLHHGLLADISSDTLRMLPLSLLYGAAAGRLVVLTITRTLGRAERVAMPAERLVVAEERAMAVKEAGVLTARGRGRWIERRSDSRNEWSGPRGGGGSTIQTSFRGSEGPGSKETRVLARQWYDQWGSRRNAYVA
jgi:hypothetical protein